MCSSNVFSFSFLSDINVAEMVDQTTVECLVLCF